MSDIIKIDEKYKAWLSDVSNKFRQSQIRAATKVNEEMLCFYFWLGWKIHFLKSEVNVGNNFYNEVSKGMKENLPDVKSFSPTNLKYMQYYYELYGSPQLGDLAKNCELSPQLGW